MKTTRKIGWLVAGAALGYLVARDPWNALHNGVIHPLYVVFPDNERVDGLHDRTAEKWEHHLWRLNSIAPNANTS